MVGKNRFYQDFDEELLHPSSPRTEDYRSAFQIDRDRLIHSSALRRLQSKTQVFAAGQYDFYRTRLTHTIEVAQIGRSLCHFLNQRSPLLAEDFFLDESLVEATCLAHDLGHPPFGHAGEATLNALTAQWGGFEGNAQTLRILSETLYQGERGMNPTRALLDGVLKYKTLHGEWLEQQGEPPKRHFLYDEQEEILRWVHAGADLGEVPVGKQRNAQRSIECQIMDWADDTAYSLNDLADGVQARFITTAQIEQWAGNQSLDFQQQGWIEELMLMVREDRVEGRLGRKVGQFIQAASLRERESEFGLVKDLASCSHRYQFELVIDAEVQKQCSLYKKLAFELIFRSPQLQQVDRKADRFLRALWEEFWRAHGQGASGFQLLPDSWALRLGAMTEERHRARVVSDWLSSLTDSSALQSYRRLFDPSFGRISDWE